MGNRSAIIGLLLMFSMLAYAEDPGKAPPASTKKDAAQQTKATPGRVPEKDVSKGVSGQDESPKVPAKVTWLDCFSQDMQVTAQQQGLRLGGTLEVSSQGKCAQAILDAKDKESLTDRKSTRLNSSHG